MEAAMPHPVAPSISLSADDRSTLEGWRRRRKTAQDLALRARIVLACAEGMNNSAVARQLGTTRPTVSKWRSRFAAHGVQGLLDQPRPGAPRQIGDAAIERLVALTLETAPEQATHWSTRSMAAKSGLSQAAVSRIWRTFGLTPHRSEAWKLSTDPLFIEKVRDVVGLYMNPPDHALVLCVDEKPQTRAARLCRDRRLIQATERTAPVLPMRPSEPERMSHDYKRHGTTDLFAALDVKTGRVIGSCKPRHRSLDFRAFLDEVEASVPEDLEVHLILDNLQTHKTPLIHAWFLKQPHWQLHFTPTYGSWLNLVEGWFALLTRRRLQRGVFTSTAELEAAIQAYVAHNNAHPKPFVWTKSADTILASVGRYCQRISGSGH
jgi:transposase